MMDITMKKVHSFVPVYFRNFGEAYLKNFDISEVRSTNGKYFL